MEAEVTDDLPDLPFIERDAIETWEHKGVRCVIRAGFCALNGYVRLPTSMRDLWRSNDVAGDVLPAPGWITYGPDKDGFVGFDTAHFNDYWAPDDLIGLIDDEAMYTANMLRDTNSDSPYVRRWTRALLRQEVETLAEQVAVIAEELDLTPDSPEGLKQHEGES